MIQSEINAFALQGKTIVVTGATSGIGKQIAILCSGLGASLILLGRNTERLNETMSSLHEPDNHLAYEIDINNYDAVADIIKDAVAKKGKLNGLVNCAGVSPTMPFRTTSTTKMEEVFATNVIAAMNLTKLVCKPANMISEGGSVVFIASVMGTVGEVGKSLYGMSKGALIAGAKSMAIEYAAKNIRFNTISPGVVVTPMSMSSEYSKDSDKLDFVTKLHPLGLGMPQDIAQATVFLLSGASRWITGVDLKIDGGYTAK
ncbi:SDR family NAD(P)-dependent oxidoreductase [Flavobacterium arcticum]|uniref:SDR family NAD(P)-dependent oxidoreductase n=1 Tax=Flavobacterium arcticum TaxID=1784713 RepID=A0A345H984_9FLAO|nr:SDR family oxidoreductase [Flavobacterium arcticum]AXG73144.1 SDR family NAD(P)-dependent oxidoreductase [Flavobacterium arcticum]KAF2512936.1 SDR family oxidoreductase [Flavobacterium arcticum]